MEKKKLFKVILGGVVSSFVFGGCDLMDQELQQDKLDHKLEEPDFFKHEKIKRDQAITELTTAKKVAVEAYNGEEVETFVNKDSVDLILMIAYYDAMETKLYGSPVKSYTGDDLTTSYYNLNYQAILNAFNKKIIGQPTQEELRKIYEELLNEWNLWNLSYCPEEVQQAIALKMVEQQSNKYQNYSFEYVDHEIIYENCKHEDMIVKVPVYSISMKASQKKKHEVIKDRIISVLPDPALVREAKKAYYQAHEKSMLNFGVYRQKNMPQNERYILLKQYYDRVPDTNYKYLFYVLQCQKFIEGEWTDMGQVTVNQDLFQSLERIGEISFPFVDENLEVAYNVIDATAYVQPSLEAIEILEQESTSYHR